MTNSRQYATGYPSPLSFEELRLLIIIDDNELARAAIASRQGDRSFGSHVRRLRAVVLAARTKQIRLGWL